MPMHDEIVFSPAIPPMFSQQDVKAGTMMRLGVGVVIWDTSGRVLLEQRSDCGWWGLPGGHLEVGESVIQTAIREVREETGFFVEIVGLVGIYSDPASRIVIYPDKQDGVQLLDVVVEARVIAGTLTCSSESLDVRFFPSRALPIEVVPPSRQPLKDAIAGRCGQLC